MTTPTEMTIRRMAAAIQAGTLREPFRATDVNRALGIASAGRLLVRHCQDTGVSTARFIRVGAGVYRLKNQPKPSPPEPSSALT